MSVTIKKILAISGFVIVAAVMILVLAIEIVEPRIDISGLAKSLEKPIGKALGRRVELGGRISVALSLHPALEASDVSIANPEGHRYPVLARAGRLQCRISLWNLLFRELSLVSLEAGDVAVYLASRPTPKDAPAAEQKPGKTGGGLTLQQVGGIDLRNIMLVYYDEGLGRQYEFQLEQLRGDIKRNADVRLEAKGHIDQYPFQADLMADAFGSFQGMGRWKTAVKGSLGQSTFEAAGEIARLEQGLKSASTVRLSGVDVGALLQWFSLADGLQAGAGQVDVELEWSGHDLASVINSIKARAALENGYWFIRDANTKAQAQIRLNRGELNVSPGRRITLALHGSLDDVPAEIVITGPVPGENIGLDKPVRLDLAAEMAGAQLHLNSRGKLPLKTGKLSLGFDMRGKTMATLGQLIKVKTPCWGPYELKGELRVGPGGYELADLELMIGQSDLRGGLSLNTAAAKPRLNLDLKTKLLLLDDFFPPGQRGENAVDALKGGGKAKEKTGTVGRGGNGLLDKEVLDSFDAKLAVSVDEVRSGDDTLGSGRLDVSLTDGTLAVQRLELNIPGGRISAGASYKPAKDQADLLLSIHMRNFDYGVLARRNDPEAKAGGLVSLNAEVRGPVRPDIYLFAEADGYLDLWIKPKDLAAGVMDLWAANMLMAVFRSLTSEDKSKINCLLAELRLTAGVLKQKSLVIDTTTMRVEGRAEVDFNKQQAHMYLEPMAKYPQFFSLETPIEVGGAFSDFKAGLASGGLVGTAIYFITSPLHVPLRRLFGQELPADGCDICCNGLEKQAEKNKN